MTGAIGGRRRRLAGVLVAALVLTAGCAGLPVLDSRPDEPDSDRLGWENGYWYDDPIAVTPDDGYNESERSAIIARQMARLERIRGLEFNHTVPVEVISRQEYVSNRSGGGGSPTQQAWNDQVWEGLFIVGESTGTGESFNTTLGASIAGYYSPGDEQIVVVSDSATPTIDRQTLAHELVHALQDQHFGLGPAGETQDQQLANDGVIEGEARYIENTYRQRCGGSWACLPGPDSGSGGGDGGTPSDFNRGLYLAIYQPYATGPAFVDSAREGSGLFGGLFGGGSGWSAVNALHSDFPDSTEQVIHPETYPGEEPVNVTVPDRSNDEWNRFEHDPVADTVGEASIYAMLYSNGVASPNGQVLGYRSTPSAGWGGDSLVPYTDGTNGTEGAYVWETAWDTERDAREFHGAYVDLLESVNATSPTENVYVVPESSAFGDAFRVVRNGDTVRIVNAPAVEQLDAVHAPRE